jgi:hypothetical protein
MSTATVTIPQPLNGLEIRKGIAKRMTENVPAEIQATLQEQIEEGLTKTCSLTVGSAYAKFKASWTLTWWKQNDTVFPHWWVDYELNDFGRVTRAGIGDNRRAPGKDAVTLTGIIPETPPDRFRQETDQPIPKPTELKKPEEPAVTTSRSVRGTGRRRSV